MTFTITEQHFLDQLFILKSLEDKADGEEQVCNIIDFLQSSQDEKIALSNFVEYLMRSKNILGEWAPHTMDCSDSDAASYLVAGCGDFNSEHYRRLDIAEMDRDMEIFEEEQTTHQLFAESPWESRSNATVNRRSETNLSGIVTAIGDAYGIAKTSVGKVFIPKNNLFSLQIGDNVIVRSQFKGFDLPNGISLPWRCLSIVQNDGQVLEPPPGINIAHAEPAPDTWDLTEFPILS